MFMSVNENVKDTIDVNETIEVHESIEDKMAQVQDDIRVLSEDLAYLHEYITEFYLSVDMKIRELGCCRECKQSMNKKVDQCV